jgi:hypothetical protein
MLCYATFVAVPYNLRTYLRLRSVPLHDEYLFDLFVYLKYMMLSKKHQQHRCTRTAFIQIRKILRMCSTMFMAILLSEKIVHLTICHSIIIIFPSGFSHLQALPEL